MRLMVWIAGDEGGERIQPVALDPVANGAVAIEIALADALLAALFGRLTAGHRLTERISARIGRVEAVGISPGIAAPGQAGLIGLTGLT